MASKTEFNASQGHCCGGNSPKWLVHVVDGDYLIPAGTLVSLKKKGRTPNEHYKLKLEHGRGYPCPELKSLALIRVVRQPSCEISDAELAKMVAGWQHDYLKASYDIIGSKFNYMMGFGRVAHVPTLALFIQSKYRGTPENCRTFAFVLKKLDEIPKKGGGVHTDQGGVIHGVEN